MADFKSRIRNIQRETLRILDSIPYTVVTINAADLEINERVYRFELDEFILRNIDAQIGDLVDSIMLDGGPSSLWFMNAYITPAYQQGTAQSHANLAVQSAEYAITKPSLEGILLSDPYRRRLGLIRARQFENMKGFAGALKDTLSRTLTEGMALGHNPRKVALAIKARTGVSLSRANTIARTEITTALRKARMDETEDAQERLGIQTMEMHLSAFSPTTRIKHARRHGTLHTIQDQREWWSVDGNSINCYLPGTRVAGRFVAGSKASYNGPTVNLVAANGSNLTVTPNHPIMTVRGLVPAAEICEGDYLLAYSGEVKFPAGPVALNDQAGPAPIEQVFRSLVQLGHFHSAGVNAVDFHGDGEFIKGNVEIVRAERVLSCGADPELGEALDGLALKHADSVAGSAHGSSCFDFFAVDLTTPRGVGGVGIGGPLFGAHLRGASQGPVAPGINLESCLIEPSDNYGPGHAKPSGQFLNGYSGHVEAVKVINVVGGYFSGHVYDLEECSGLMVAENIIASNCKCSTVSILVDDDGKPLTPSIVERAQQLKQKKLK